MRVSACLKLASSALLIGVTAGSDRLRRTQQTPHGGEWMTNGERDAVMPANSTMPGDMGNTTMPGIANSTMPGMANSTTMANITTTTTNMTRRAKTVGAVNHSSAPMDPNARNATTTTNSTDAAAANTTTPGMANNSMPAGTGALPTPTRDPHTSVGGRNVSGGVGVHRMLRATDYASSLTNATMPASADNSTLNSTMPGMDNTTMPGMANATTATNTTTTADMPTRFLMHMMMENATMPLGGGNSSLPMPNSTIPLSNTTVPGLANATINSTTLVGVRTPATTRLLSTHRMRARMGDNATMPGMMNSTMPMGPGQNATTNSTMPAGMDNSTTLSNTTTMMGVGH